MYPNNARLHLEELEMRANPTEFWWFPTDGSNWHTVRPDGTTNWRHFDKRDGAFGNWVQSKSVPGKDDVALFTANEFGGGNSNCVVDKATTVKSIVITGGITREGNNAPGQGSYTKTLMLAPISRSPAMPPIWIPPPRLPAKSTRKDRRLLAGL